VHISTAGLHTAHWYRYCPSRRDPSMGLGYHGGRPLPCRAGSHIPLHATHHPPSPLSSRGNSCTPHMRSKGVTLRRWLGRVGCALNWHRMGSLVWVQCAIVRSSKRTNLLVRVLRELVRCVDIAAPHPSSTTAGSVCRFSDDAAERKRSTALNRQPMCPTQQHAESFNATQSVQGNPPTPSHSCTHRNCVSLRCRFSPGSSWVDACYPLHCNAHSMPLIHDIVNLVTRASQR
jgi:hypothetical protein